MSSRGSPPSTVIIGSPNIPIITSPTGLSPPDGCTPFASPPWRAVSPGTSSASSKRACTSSSDSSDTWAGGAELERVVLQGRVLRIEDKHGVRGGNRARRDQMDVVLMLDDVERLALSGPGINQDDRLLVRSQQRRYFVEIVDDDPSVEAIDHAVAEANGDDCCPHGCGRSNQLGGHGGQEALHLFGRDGEVNGPVAAHIDQHCTGGAVAHGGKSQGNGRGSGGFVDDARIGGEGQVPDVWAVGPTCERGHGFPAVAGHQHLEAIVDQFDTHHLRWCHCGHLGSVAEQLGKVAEPERLAGPGVVAQLQFEISERALRLRPGDAAAEGPAAELPTSPAVECGDQTDGGKAKEAGTHGQRSNVAPRRVRNGWTNLGTGVRPLARGWQVRHWNGGGSAVVGTEWRPPGTVGSVWLPERRP